MPPEFATLTSSKQEKKSWETWNRRGLFPGVEESEAQFLKRISSLSPLSETAKQIPPRFVEEWGLAPDWVPITLSKKGLSPWEAGCSWIGEGAPPVEIQIHPSKKNQEEVLMHELMHAGRYHLNQHYFEEVLAYQTSSKTWRRYLGAWILSTKESLFFVSLLFCAFLADFFAPWDVALILNGLLTVTGIYFSLRLCALNFLFGKALNNMASYVTKERTKQLIYRMTDREIYTLATKGILPKDDSFRWKFLRVCYLNILS